MSPIPYRSAQIPKLERLTGSFIATDDDGRHYTIHVYITFAATEDSEIPVSRRFETTGGERLNRPGKGESETVVGRLKLHSDDPVAN